MAEGMFFTWDDLVKHNAKIRADAWDEGFAATTDAAPEDVWFASWNALNNPYRPTHEKEN